LTKDAPNSASTSFAHVLHAAGPDRQRESKLALYGWLVGSWNMEVVTILEDGKTHHDHGEIHAGWVLQGRAIQDVWMIPRLEERKPGVGHLPGAGNWYGTTLRIYDPNIDACGTTPRQMCSPSRLGARGAVTSCRKALTREALASCAGPSRKSRQTRFTGLPSVLKMRKVGAAKSTSGRADRRNPTSTQRLGSGGPLMALCGRR
jgi:hypothetical protein